MARVDVTLRFTAFTPHQLQQRWRSGRQLAEQYKKDVVGTLITNIERNSEVTMHERTTLSSLAHIL